MIAPNLFGGDLLPAEEALQLPCFNNPAKFQDTDRAYLLKEAAEQCKTSCRQRVWCEQRRLDTVAEHGLALGVWAGEIWRYRDYAQKDASPSRVIMPESAA